MNRLLFPGRVTWVALTVAILALTCQASDLAITSFGGSGQLVFDTLDDGTNYVYRVEWAPTASGPWSCFDGAAGLLQNISSENSGSVTSVVPMCYRVVALPPHLLGMVRIPGGTNSGTDPDFGAYSLTVEEFYMDATEVTKAKWDEVYTWAISNGYSFDNAGTNKAPNHPVHTVNWYDVVKWCNARSQKEGLPAVYTVGGAVYKTGQSDNVVQTSAAGYRLPTDVEWEYAARGGVANRRFPWGDSDFIDHGRANYYSYWSGGAPYYPYDKAISSGYHPTYNDGTMPYTSSAGSFAANGYGLYDMSGNVWEWCFDWHPSFVGSFRVMRGGSWCHNADRCRVGSRNNGGPYIADYFIGFRAVLPPGQQ